MNTYLMWRDINALCACGHLRRLDQLGGSWFVVAGRDADLVQHSRTRFNTQNTRALNL